MVKVTIEKGHASGQSFTPHLQATIEVTGDNSQNWEVASQREWASEDEKDIYTWWPFLGWVYSYSIKTTAKFYDHYYFDVSDADTEVQVGGTLHMELSIFGWGSLMSGEVSHDLMNGNEPNAVSHEMSSGGHKLTLSTETIQVGRVNTIAVYENGSFSEEYGHYRSKEKMSAGSWT